MNVLVHSPCTIDLQTLTFLYEPKETTKVKVMIHKAAYCFQPNIILIGMVDIILILMATSKDHVEVTPWNCGLSSPISV